MRFKCTACSKTFDSEPAHVIRYDDEKDPKHEQPINVSIAPATACPKCGSNTQYQAPK